MVKRFLAMVCEVALMSHICGNALYFNARHIVLLGGTEEVFSWDSLGHCPVRQLPLYWQKYLRVRFIKQRVVRLW
ncbi:unnamed protein product [Gongylonema pulchrum]|uniref:Secreted protein n=1 Tax=Gongylonema pulchrum TaxID=637853 RepID=A0A183E8S1_9BILA|nr:unnamed protein product [Gongylonema pulchrum]